MKQTKSFEAILKQVFTEDSSFLIVDRELNTLSLGLACTETKYYSEAEYKSDYHQLLSQEKSPDTFCLTLLPYTFDQAPAIHLAPTKRHQQAIPPYNISHMETVSQMEICKVFAYQPSATKEAYAGQFEAAKAALRRGDVFQLVLSNTFSLPQNSSGFDQNCQMDLLMALFNDSAVPFLIYVRTADYIWISATPEILVEKDGQDLLTVPIAGTCPRQNDGLDALRAESLAKDPKECAEHLMLVDLSRNDLGRVSQIGSVQVPIFAHVKASQAAQHLVSHVVSTISEEGHPLDPVFSTLPAGTVTGAPKKKAMALIDAIEQSPRCYYGGAFLMHYSPDHYRAYLHIRTLEYKRLQLHLSLRVGSGIVIDSTVDGEAKELCVKASGILNLLKKQEHFESKGATYDLVDR